MPTSFDTPNKICIRNNFNKLVIRYLKEKCGYNIIYFGLPSPDAEDIQAWLDYISNVIAFQCRDYSQISDPDQPTNEVDKLISKLNAWETAGKIDEFTVYDGYMEEVLFNGYDNSAGGSIKYRHDKCITLFNLDFCNKITSPQEYINIKGEHVKKYKFELIDKILEYQKFAASPFDRFVLFLTINSGYSGHELSEYYDKNSKDINAKYSGLSQPDKKQFILKHYVEYFLYEKIRLNGFVPQFLPTIFYSGLHNVKMMQFAAMCIKPHENRKQGGVYVYHQEVSDVLSTLPIIPDGEKNAFSNYPGAITRMENAKLNFMKAFCDSGNFKKYWNVDRT